MVPTFPLPRNAGQLDRHREGVAAYRDGLAGHAPAVTRPAALAEMSIPEGETVTEISDRLVPFFRRED
jgi:hypothetical protein